MLEYDLIMKGGITSGVVYPHAIAEVARKFRLRNIGGTSAGAIAAVFANTAEYRRQAGGGQEMAGFDEIGKVAEELGSGMRGLFQPTPELRPLFALLLAAISEDARAGHKVGAFGRALIRSFPLRFLIGFAVMALGILVAYLAGSFGSVRSAWSWVY